MKRFRIKDLKLLKSQSLSGKIGDRANHLNSHEFSDEFSYVSFEVFFEPSHSGQFSSLAYLVPGLFREPVGTGVRVGIVQGHASSEEEPQLLVFYPGNFNQSLILNDTK